ncbi:hypothetical protein [Bacillus licheniformis]|uniref:hypothetical protein n=1 Tax=Bacillus licheniformis TaxID=1402 RepID=UPI003723170B
MCILDEIGFTPDQYFELKNQGIRDIDIAAKELYVSLRQLNKWKKKHGVKCERKSRAKKFTREEWEAKRKEGMIEAEIAEHFGYSKSSHYLKYKRSIGIEPMKTKVERTPELLAEIKGYLDQGLTRKEIAKRLSVKMTAVNVGRIIKQEGLENRKEIGA